MRKQSAIYLLVLILSGCSSPTLIVTSQPKGALITDVASGRSYGIIKDDHYGVHIEYKLNSDSKDQDGCYLLTPLRAEWPSGTYKQDTIRICGMKPFYTYTFSRPNGPGLDVDLNFASQLDAARNARIEKSNAEIDAALLSVFRSLGNMNNNQTTRQSTPVQRTLFLRNQWYNNGNSMCSYDDGSVVNMGSGVCPTTR